jgi:NAD(P)-dependent dehydrogenase (short-subunit alcohol dehydrogenase family)
MQQNQGRLHGRVAIVVNGAVGIGEGIARRLRAEDAQVIAVEAPRSRAEAEAMVAEVLGRHGRLDILINAGDEPTTFAPIEQKISAVDGTAQAVLWTMQAAFPALREKGGRIVNLVAPLGDSLNRQAADAVAASEAIKSLTRSAAEEWGRYNILVNALATAADTPAFRRLRERAPEAVDGLVAASPMQRMGDPVQDIGGAVMLLLSESGRFLTGHVLYADGGQHLTPTPYEALVPME